jgi:hypothetical protein
MQSEQDQEKYRQINLASLEVIQYEAAKEEERYQGDANVGGRERFARDFE